MEKSDLIPEGIAKCDQEKIQFYNSIQSHGYLLGFSWPDQRIQVVSENISSLLDGEDTKSAVLGAKLDHFFEKNFINALSGLVSTYPWSFYGKHIEMRPNLKGKQYDAYIFHSDGVFFVEFEEYVPHFDISVLAIEGQERLKEFSRLAKESSNLMDLSRLLCSTVRAITGLDRVMMYRFLAPSWHGEVIAEDRVANVHSYLGHRFPASDIPKPARDLYLRNHVRLIPDAKSANTGLKPKLNPKTQKNIDLSDSRLRAVAPIHLQYLSNMGVAASFSVAITDGEDLWGLLTCHHMQPIMISQSQRTLCEILCNVYSIQAPLLFEADKLKKKVEFEDKLKKLIVQISGHDQPATELLKLHRMVGEVFGAAGCAVISDDAIDFAGLTPLRADIADIAKFLREKMKNENRKLVSIENLSEINPEWARFKNLAAGVMGVDLQTDDAALLLTFRPELIRTITWGGDPRKQLEKRNFDGDIHPRNSFDTWTQNLSNSAQAWTDYEQTGLQFLAEVAFKR